MKFCVPETFRNSAGVYIIRAAGYNQVYVGSAKNLATRYANHVSTLKKNQHSAVRLQAFVSEHGLSLLSFELLESTPLGSDLAGAEQKWLDTLQPYDPEKGFNSLAKVWNASIVEEKDAVLVVPIPKTLHEQAKKRAKSRGVSLAGYVRQLIIDDLERAKLD